jgi:hypothetical protein
MNLLGVVSTLSRVSFLPCPLRVIKLDERTVLCALSPDSAQVTQAYYNGGPFGNIDVK